MDMRHCLNIISESSRNLIPIPRPEIEDLEFFGGAYDTKKRVAWIGVIAISTNQQRKGSGAAAMKQVEDWVREQGGTVINGESLENAVPFWKKMGYEVSSTPTRKWRYPISKKLTPMTESPNSGSTIPKELAFLAHEISGKSWEVAKRIVVSKTGSVSRSEKFDDDLADSIFLRIQRNSQIGRYTSLKDLQGRNPRRLDGVGTIKLFRAAPKGGGIRPGDYAAGSREEAGFYSHGKHVIQVATVPRVDVIAVDGSMGGGQEYVYLPDGYTAPEVVEHFASFSDFYEAASAQA